MRRSIVAPFGGVGLAIAVLSVMLATGNGSRPAAALSNCSTTEDGLAANEQLMIQLYNQHRVSIGKPAFKISPALNRAAAWMANDQATKVGLSHTDSLGRDAFTRGADCGVLRMTAENAAEGSSDANAVFGMWLASSGHRAAIEGNYLMVGMGEKNGYWTADFGNYDDSAAGSSPAGGSPSPSPTPTRTNTPTNTPISAPTPTPTPATAAYRVRMELPAGTSLVTYVGGNASPATVLASLGSTLVDCYYWDPGILEWERYGPGAPTFAQTLSTMTPGNAYFIRVRSAAVWTY